MTEERHKRSIDIIDPEKLNFPIHILGCGGIGSWTALLLAKMGCSDINVYDDDNVEDHNVASQFFKENQLGMKKTEALAQNVLEQTGIEIFTASKIIEQDINKGIIIIAIDSMERRIQLEKYYKNRYLYLIDARMGGLQLEIYSTYSDNYSKTLVNPLDVSPDPCTAKSICFNCAVIAGLIANLVRKYTNEDIFYGNLIFGFNNLELLKSYE